LILACLPVVLRLRDGHRMIMLCDEARARWHHYHTQLKAARVT
jgi:hypothetical protein